jgi:predicted phage terminase large subunit-like protein
MVSRNRSTCGVRSYIRATCNPDADSWVANFLAWWIDPETGLPIPERAGVLRYYIRVAGNIVWADRPEELMQHLPRPRELPAGFELPRPISVTFIPARVFDNPALLRVNPDYLAWLLALPLLERERLLGGNWKIRPAAGLYFKREWCTVVDEIPADLNHIVRYWDLAATEKTEFNDPDWTVGIKLGRDRSGGFWVLDMVRRCANPGDVERLLLDTAAQDGKRVRIGFGQDPGQAGKSQAQHLVRALSGFTVNPASETGDKLTRFGPFSSQCRAGNVKIRRGAWNEELFRASKASPISPMTTSSTPAAAPWKCSIRQCGAGPLMNSCTSRPRRFSPRSTANRKAPHPIPPAARWNGEPCRTAAISRADAPSGNLDKSKILYIRRRRFYKGGRLNGSSRT